ncbi:MAG: acetyltransferase-like isoleucine patch superfamily enzyme [Parvicella sp.]|jgi:acetyltransferase-like isoleucine patch superfamily enzyme
MVILRALVSAIKMFLAERKQQIRFQKELNVRLEKGVQIDESVKSIGEYTFIGSNTVLGPSCEKVGKFCSIASDCLIGPNSHPISRFSTSSIFDALDANLRIDQKLKQTRKEQYNRNKVTIGNDVWIGAKVIILPGVQIGDGAIIGAGSIVTKDIGFYEIAVGNPSRIVKKRFSEDIIQKLIMSNIYEIESPSLLRILSDFQGLEMSEYIDELVESVALCKTDSILNQ